MWNAAVQVHLASHQIGSAGKWDAAASDRRKSSAHPLLRFGRTRRHSRETRCSPLLSRCPPRLLRIAQIPPCRETTVSGTPAQIPTVELLQSQTRFDRYCKLHPERTYSSSTVRRSQVDSAQRRRVRVERR